MNSSTSEFERREAARRKQRIQRLEALTSLRLQSAVRHDYYAQEVQRLVSSLIVPGSRVLEVGSGLGDLLASIGAESAVGIDVSASIVAEAKKRHPNLDFRVLDVERDPLPEGRFDVILLSDAIGLLDDIEVVLERLRPLLSERGQLIVTYYSFLWEPILKLAEVAGQKTRWPDQNWLSMGDVENLLRLSGFEVFRRGTDVLVPARLPLVSTLANRVVSKLPVVRELSLVDYFVARAVPETLPEKLPSVSIICPTRNEKGNIREAVLRTPMMGPRTELIFVDGNSTDGTVEEIEAVIREYKGPLELKLVLQGTGKGKGDAVRKGFAAAQCDVLMILDSDLTVPPEDLPKFYRALVTGKGQFINGVRLG